MNPYPYAPSSNQPIYPPSGAYPPTGAYPQTGAYPPPTTAYTPAVVPQAAPAQYFGGMTFVYVQDPITEIGTCPSLLIKQEPELFEGLTGCEQPNIYHVFGNSPLGVKYLFKCMEKSGFCMRRFCPSTQRSFDMDIIHCSSVDQLGLGYTIPFATMQKPFMCTCCCICRPEIEVRLNSTSQSIGKVKYICTMCDPTFEVYSMTGGLKYIVTADCCQCALRCPGFISKTSRGTFEILDASNNQRVGQITKEPSASVSEMITDADTYIVNFPQTADAYDKLLITGLALMIDYQFFETDAGDEHKSRTRGKSNGRRRRY